MRDHPVSGINSSRDENFLRTSTSSIATMAAAMPPPNIKPMTALEAQEFLTRPGGLFELAPTNVRGEMLRCWKHAPPSVRDVWLNSVKVSVKTGLKWLELGQNLSRKGETGSRVSLSPRDTSLGYNRAPFLSWDARWGSLGLEWTEVNVDVGIRQFFGGRTLVVLANKSSH